MGLKLKVIEITICDFPARWEALTEISASDLGLEFIAETRRATHENFAEILNEAMKSDADAILLDNEFSSESLKCITQTTHDATMAGACSLFVKEKGGWWPRGLLTEGFARTLSTHVGQLDLKSSALIIGGGGYSKLVIASLVKTGFSKVNVVEESIEAGLAFVSEMKRSFFRVDFNFIPHNKVTTLPGVHSIVVNTSLLNLENTLLDELYFFNFLKAGGVVVDFNLIPPRTPLIEEAEIWGARHLSGDYPTAHTDAYLLEVMREVKLDVEKYRTLLRSKMDAVPFDTGPFLQKFRDRGS